jgi:hypothetical protein
MTAQTNQRARGDRVKSQATGDDASGRPSLVTGSPMCEASRPAAPDASGSTTAGRDGSGRRGRRGQRSRGPNAARRRAIRGQLAARDGACCFYCGHRFVVLAEATIDHLVPQCQVPGWKLANLVLACGPCNHAKGDRLPQQFLRPHAFGPGLTPVRTSRIRALIRAVRILLAVFMRTLCGAAGVRAVSGPCERSACARSRSRSARSDSTRRRSRSAAACSASERRRSRSRMSAHDETPVSGDERSKTGRTASMSSPRTASACGPHRTTRTDSVRTRRTGDADHAGVPVEVCGWLRRRHAA